MTNSPLVSFLMPVFNAEKYLAESIQSVLVQDYENIELIIVNDGSSDSSGKIAEEYAASDSRVAVLHKKNSGIVDTLNEGMTAVKGEYVARLDADDLCLPDRISKQLAYMQENSIDLCGGGLEMIGSSNRKKLYPESHAELLVNLFTYGRSIPHPTLLVKAKVMQQFKYSDQYPHAEDFALWLQIAITSDYKIGNMPSVLIKYRVHDEQVTQQKKTAQLTSVFSAIHDFASEFSSDITKDELDLNYRVCKCRENLTASELEEYLYFILKIKKSMLDKGVSDRFLCLKWFDVCFRHRKLGKKIYQLFCSYGEVPANLRKKLLLRTLIRL